MLGKNPDEQPVPPPTPTFGQPALGGSVGRMVTFQFDIPRHDAPPQSAGATPGASPTAATGPISVSAPRAAAVPPAAAAAPTATAHGPTRLAELVARAEGAIERLGTQLHEERAAAERAARATVDIDERLRLGVRMLQAFDVQFERGEQCATRAQSAVESAERTIEAAIERAVSERLGEITRRLESELESRLASQIERQIEGLLATRVTHAVERAEESVRSLAQADASIAERIEGATARVESLGRELDWRFTRIGEVESRLEEAANSKLAWLDGELAQRAERLAGAVADAESRLSQSEAVLARLDGIETLVAGIIDRSERATAALGGLTADGERQIESLAQRIGDASALREALGTLIHELHASREVVGGELRRMRDDLGWLVEKGERLSGELVERADSAAQKTDSLRSSVASAEPLVTELATWRPLLEGRDPARVQPVAEAIAANVRNELASDMRGFAAALRQLAARADGAFAHIRVDPAAYTAPIAVPDGGGIAFHSGSDLARSFAQELGRLGGPREAGTTGEPLVAPPLTVNQPVELDIAEPAFPAGTPVPFGSNPAATSGSQP